MAAHSTAAIAVLIVCFLFVSAGKDIVSANIIYVFTVIAVCEISRYLVYQSRTWFNGHFTRLKRILSLFALGCFSTSIIFIVSKAARNYIAYGEFKMNSSYGSNVYVNNTQLTVGVIGSSIFYAVLAFTFLFLVYEILYHFARLRFIEKQNNRLEKEKLQAELQQLKGIVNPHFLFNNLNSLSSLITEDPAQAEGFLNELTKVFRYLLRNNNTELTTVAEELQFIDSYYHLLQTRHGKSILLDIRVGDKIQAYLLPPMTLQLLVENAVKHNRLHKEAPLKIEIFSEGEDRLVVRNNLSKRDQAVESTGIGLQSIKLRYGLLQQTGPEIKEDGQFFSVTIPLIVVEERAAPAPLIHPAMLSAN
jgi:two-component system, LytTR family, sensor kinase